MDMAGKLFTFTFTCVRPANMVTLTITASTTGPHCVRLACLSIATDAAFVRDGGGGGTRCQRLPPPKLVAALLDGTTRRWCVYADTMVVGMSGDDMPGLRCGSGSACILTDATFLNNSMPESQSARGGAALGVISDGRAWLQVPHPPTHTDVMYCLYHGRPLRPCEGDWVGERGGGGGGGDQFSTFPLRACSSGCFGVHVCMMPAAYTTCMFTPQTLAHAPQTLAANRLN